MAEFGYQLDGRREVRMAINDVMLEGTLTLPDNSQGLVLFAHGSGSSRFSPRNNFVAEQLQRAGIGTLLFDLLTAAEEEEDRETRHLRFDIGLLASRLVSATDWVGVQSETRGLQVGYFGASTGGGAALVAAAARPLIVGAVVSRGGRPDLAGPCLPHVKCPTLLIVGGYDTPVIEMNREAMHQMTTQVTLEVVPRASHLFEERGTLEAAAQLARDFFEDHLGANTGVS